MASSTRSQGPPKNFAELAVEKNYTFQTIKNALKEGIITVDEYKNAIQRRIVLKKESPELVTDVYIKLTKEEAQLAERTKQLKDQDEARQLGQEDPNEEEDEEESEEEDQEDPEITNLIDVFKNIVRPHLQQYGTIDNPIELGIPYTDIVPPVTDTQSGSSITDKGKRRANSPESTSNIGNTTNPTREATGATSGANPTAQQGITYDIPSNSQAIHSISSSKGGKPKTTSAPQGVLSGSNPPPRRNKPGGGPPNPPRAHGLPVTAAAMASPKMKTPDTYDGARRGIPYHDWESSVDMYITIKAGDFPTNEVKVTWAGGLLRGVAQTAFNNAYRTKIPANGTAVPPIIASPAWMYDWDEFKEEMTKLFGDPNIKDSAIRKIMSVKHVTSAAAYETEFMTWAVYTGWNDDTLRFWYQKGLKEKVREHLTAHTLTTFADYRAKAVQLDAEMFNIQKDKGRTGNTNNFASGSKQKTGSRQRFQKGGPKKFNAVSKTDEPVKTNVFQKKQKKQLSQEERERYLREGLCFQCGQKGHNASSHTKGKQPFKKNVRATKKKEEKQYVDKELEEFLRSGKE